MCNGQGVHVGFSGRPPREAARGPGGPHKVPRGLDGGALRGCLDAKRPLRISGLGERSPARGRGGPRVSGRPRERPLGRWTDPSRTDGINLRPRAPRPRRRSQRRRAGFRTNIRKTLNCTNHAEDSTSQTGSPKIPHLKHQTPPCTPPSPIAQNTSPQTPTAKRRTPPQTCTHKALDKQ